VSVVLLHRELGRATVTSAWSLRCGACRGWSRCAPVRRRALL